MKRNDNYRRGDGITGAKRKRMMAALLRLEYDDPRNPEIERLRIKLHLPSSTPETVESFRRYYREEVK